jgi:PAS domain S-box-containing protein
MKDQNQSKTQLIHELAAMRRRVVELEESENERKRSEVTLHEMEEMFRLFMKHSPICVFFKDEHIRAMQLSENYEKILGRPMHELIGKTMEDLFPSELAKSMVQDDLRILHEGKPIEVMEQLNGRYYTTTKFPITREGKPPLLAGFTMDITERKQAEEALRKEKEIAQEYLDIAGVILLVINVDGEITLINRRGCEILGYKEEEMIGKNWFDVFLPERERLRVKQVFTKLMVGEVEPVEYFENLALTRSGEERIIAWHNTLLTGDNGNNIGTLSSGEDVTERRQMEETLRKSEEKFRDLYDRAPVGYHEYDTDGRITSVNRTELGMLGYTAEEMIGQFIWKFSVEEEARLEVLAKLAWTLPPAKNLERAYRRKDGTTLPVMIENQLVLDEKGRIKGIRSTVHDITERKRMEEERRNLETRLQRVERMEALGTLAGGVAHDLNNILSGLVGYPDLILMQLPESSPLREPVLGIQRSGQRAAAIVQDLLTLTMRGMVSLEVMNLNRVISDYMKTPEQEKTQSFHPDVRFEVSLGSDLLPIKGSSVHFSKAVMNLLSNAAEAIPERGVVTISTRNQYLDRPITGYDHVKEGDYVVLEVSDTGRGISPGDMGRIFEPFYTKKNMGRSGTGLGLAVVWGTVKDHNGYIDVRSEEGSGTTFRLYFPVTREALTGDQPPVSLSDYMGKEETILVVDDVMEQRELAIAMLSKLHYKVTSVSSGEEAIEYMKAGQADLLILDMIMDPGIDGLETYRRILELHPGQKAIIASGFSETERVREAQDLGVGAFIRKPYLLEKIGLLVRQELDRCPL